MHKSDTITANTFIITKKYIELMANSLTQGKHAPHLTAAWFNLLKLGNHLSNELAISADFQYFHILQRIDTEIAQFSVGTQ